MASPFPILHVKWILRFLSSDSVVPLLCLNAPQSLPHIGPFCLAPHLYPTQPLAQWFSNCGLQPFWGSDNPWIRVTYQISCSHASVLQISAVTVKSSLAVPLSLRPVTTHPLNPTRGKFPCNSTVYLPSWCQCCVSCPINMCFLQQTVSTQTSGSQPS